MTRYVLPDSNAAKTRTTDRQVAPEPRMARSGPSFGHAEPSALMCHQVDPSSFQLGGVALCPEFGLPLFPEASARQVPSLGALCDLQDRIILIRTLASSPEQALRLAPLRTEHKGLLVMSWHENPADELEAAAELARGGDRRGIDWLAHRLGWRGRGWTSAQRSGVQRALAAAGSTAIRSILNAVAECGREEVVDEAVAVLEHLVNDAAARTPVQECLVEAQRAEARIAVARALGRASGTEAWHRDVLEQLLADGEGDVREAAAWAIVHRRDPEMTGVLQRALDSEESPQVKESLRDAIEELQAR